MNNVLWGKFNCERKLCEVQSHCRLTVKLFKTNFLLNIFKKSQNGYFDFFLNNFTFLFYFPYLMLKKL